MWIAPDIRRIIIGDKDERYAIADQFPGASNRMLDLADLALGARPAKKKEIAPVVEKEQILSVAASNGYHPETPHPADPLVVKSRNKS